MERYDLVVIGAGAAGLVTASGAARLGARVALIERDRFGGECLWTGCVPSKALIEASRLAHRIRRAREWGLSVPTLEISLPKVLQQVHEIIRQIQPHDDPERFRALGVEVIQGKARFVGPDQVQVNGRNLRARRFCIATGADTLIPPIPGMDQVPFQTHESIFHLDRTPQHLLVIGGGPIGCELGQAFLRLGCRVTLIETLDCILHQDDRELACELHQILEAEGMEIHIQTRVESVESREGQIRLHCRQGDHPFTVTGDALLLATGKRARVQDLQLEAAGVAVDRNGIRVDATLRTTNPRIYACGDVVGPYRFTHMAEYQAGIVVTNALLPLIRRKMDLRVVPWCTFTDPELAHVGLSTQEAQARYGKHRVQVWEYALSENDRHRIDRTPRGKVKLTTLTNGRILGCDLLGEGAGDLIHEFALAIQKGLRVGDLSRLIHIYPTRSQVCKRVCDQYYARKFFTGWVPRFVGWWLRQVRNWVLLLALAGGLGGGLVTGTWAGTEPLPVGKFSVLDPGPAPPPGWEVQTFPRIPRHTQYRLVREEGRTVLEARSHRAASGLVRRIQVDLREYPQLQWSWRVDQAIQGSDPRSKEGDDYPVRIYIMFEYDPKAVDRWTRLQYRLGRLLFGEIPVAALAYIWTQALPPGTVIDNPYTRLVKMIVLEQGTDLLGIWVEESRNVLEDFRQAFGREPTRVGAVALMTDTDNTGEEALAFYGDLVFLGDP